MKYFLYLCNKFRHKHLNLIKNMEILNKKGIDSLISARDLKSKQELSEYKAKISTTALYFSSFSKELENIFKTFEYLDENKLHKVIHNMLFDTLKEVENNFKKNRNFVRTIKFERGKQNEFNGINYKYEFNEDKFIEFIFQPSILHNWFKIVSQNVVKFHDLNIEYLNEKLVFNCTNTAIRCINITFAKEIEFVKEEYKYIIQSLLRKIDEINNETEYE